MEGCPFHLSWPNPRAPRPPALSTLPALLPPSLLASASSPPFPRGHHHHGLSPCVLEKPSQSLEIPPPLSLSKPSRGRVARVSTQQLRPRSGSSGQCLCPPPPPPPPQTHAAKPSPHDGVRPPYMRDARGLHTRPPVRTLFVNQEVESHGMPDLLMLWSWIQPPGLRAANVCEPHHPRCFVIATPPLPSPLHRRHGLGQRVLGRPPGSGSQLSHMTLKIPFIPRCLSLPLNWA